MASGISVVITLGNTTRRNPIPCIPCAILIVTEEKAPLYLLWLRRSISASTVHISSKYLASQRSHGGRTRIRLTVELQSGGKGDCQHALKFAYHGLWPVHTLKALLWASRTVPSPLYISIHIFCPRNPLTRKYICKDCQEIFRFIAWSVIRFTTARSSV